MNTINPQQVDSHAAERRQELLASLSAERARRAGRRRSRSVAAASLLAATIGVLGGFTTAAGPTSASATHVPPPPCRGGAYPACQGAPIIHIVCGALRQGASHPSDGRDVIVDVEGVRVTDDERLLGRAQELATQSCLPAPDGTESADRHVTHRCGDTPLALTRPCAV